MLTNEEKEFVNSFRKIEAFSRVFEKILEKYVNGGKFVGKITIIGLTPTEKLSLSAIDSSIINKDNCELSIKKFFEKKIFNKNFPEITQEKFFNHYFDNVATKKELLKDKQLCEQNYYKSLISQYEGTPAARWLDSAIAQKSYGYSCIKKEYTKSPEKLEVLLNNVMTALNYFPSQKGEIIPLPVFASKIIKDPHYFDTKKTANTLLLHAISYTVKSSFPNTTEEAVLLLERFGVAKDLISSCITIYNFDIIKDGALNAAIHEFNKQQEVLTLNLKNVLSYEKIIPKYMAVFIFENPTVFLSVYEKVKDLEVSLVCTSGQLNLCSLLFLDKVVDDSLLHYSGDFDPEGLKIADSLKKRFGDRLVLWRFSEEDYLACLSDISLDNRLGKLDSLDNETLICLASKMRTVNKAGYQELLIDCYVEDICDKLEHV